VGDEGLKQDVSWRTSNLQVLRSIPDLGRYDEISTGRADVSTEMRLEQARNAASGEGHFAFGGTIPSSLNKPRG